MSAQAIKIMDQFRSLPQTDRFLLADAIFRYNQRTARTEVSKLLKKSESSIAKSGTVSIDTAKKDFGL